MSIEEGNMDPDIEEREGSWIYISGPMQVADRKRAADFYDRLAAACEAQGWHVYRPYREVEVSAKDPSPIFERFRHAVEHADALVAYIGAPSSGVGAELAMAYQHRRPIVAVLNIDEEPSALVRSMLDSYERARVVTCSNAEDCAEKVAAVLSDPGFADLVRVAAGDYTEDV